ncbi:hypothetical protein [Sphingomonas crocodyli]|uniref:Uncharacterized protein n=1 Tax=Sphingomonas crocodyli TaxID=1979270 RepID=A0A437M497_9SPHN|nr:hypothetical protein [Sphingomonas crocodyli]RVT92472.1 hypothetical protein EOD43_00620 [Sphingomonas crocodyli]
MWWFWTLFMCFWIASVSAWAAYIWRSAHRIEQRGWWSNGVGTTIQRDDGTASFRLLLIGYRAFGLIVAIAAILGVIGMIIRIAQAL